MTHVCAGDRAGVGGAGILHSEMSARVKKIGAVIKTLSEKKMVNARPHAGHRLSDVFLPHINDLL